jgi:hypothetical protein
MVEAGIGGKVIEAAAGPGFGIGCAEGDGVESGRHGGPCTHGAGFKGDDQQAVVEAPAPKGSGGVPDGQ